MDTSKLAGFLAVSGLVLAASLAYADSGNKGNIYSRGGQCEQCEKKHKWGNTLGLTDDQKKQLKENWQKQREAVQPLFEQMKDNRQALKRELLQANPDMNKIATLQNQLKSIEGQMTDSRLDSLLETKKVLTPEQFSKFLETKERHKRHKGGRHEQ